MSGALSDRLRHSIGFISEACGKKIASSIAFDRHRQSGYLRCTACYVLDDGSTRRQLVATKRAHMSSASLEKKQTLLGKRGIGNPFFWHTLHVLHIPYFGHTSQHPKGACVPPSGFSTCNDMYTASANNIIFRIVFKIGVFIRQVLQSTCYI
jgi:hypothetical protein